MQPAYTCTCTCTCKCSIQSQHARAADVHADTCVHGGAPRALAPPPSCRLRFRLGLFDPIEGQPYWHVSPDVVNSTSSQALNQLAARESMVLLQNDATMGLPFTKGGTVAVIGPHGKAASALVGNYLGQICPDGVGSYSCVETPLEAISELNAGGSTIFSAGSGVSDPIDGGIAAAVVVAKRADRTVLLLGIDEHIEGESHDRTSIDLPAPQHDLAAAVLALGKPCVVVLINGGMVGIEQERPWIRT